MPKIELNFTVEKGLRALKALTVHGFSPAEGDELQRLKKGLIKLVARETFAYEQGLAMEIAHAAMAEAEESVEEDLDIAS